MNNFQFYSPTEFVFGKDTENQAGFYVKKHGGTNVLIHYAKGDVKQRLDIVPLSLEQFRRHFVSMFEGKQARPEHLRDLILQCETERDNLEAPAWMRYIDDVVTQRVSRLINV